MGMLSNSSPGAAGEGGAARLRWWLNVHVHVAPAAGAWRFMIDGHRRRTGRADDGAAVALTSQAAVLMHDSPGHKAVPLSCGPFGNSENEVMK
jgi:hypothetical protein